MTWLDEVRQAHAAYSAVPTINGPDSLMQLQADVEAELMHVLFTHADVIVTVLNAWGHEQGVHDGPAVSLLDDARRFPTNEPVIEGIGGYIAYAICGGDAATGTHG